MIYKQKIELNKNLKYATKTFIVLLYLVSQQVFHS